MKLSFSTFACPEWELESILSAAVRYGYQGVEFRCDGGHRHGVEVSAGPAIRRDIRTRLSDAGVKPCCLATGLQFISDWAGDTSRARLELAADIGAPGLRVFCGKNPDELSIPDVIDKVGQRLREVAEIAAAIGVGLWIETHDTLARAADAAMAVRYADHPAVGLVYDNLHPFRRGESLEMTVAAISGLVRYVHFHDGVNKPDQVVIKPFGKGELPLTEMFRALVKIGYDGFVCGEWFHNMYGQDVEDSLEAYYADITGLSQREGMILGR